MTMLSLLLVIVSLFFIVVASLSALLAPTAAAAAVGHLPYGSTCTYSVQSTMGPPCLSFNVYHITYNCDNTTSESTTVMLAKRIKENRT